MQRFLKCFIERNNNEKTKQVGRSGVEIHANVIPPSCNMEKRKQRDETGVTGNHASRHIRREIG